MTIKQQGGIFGRNPSFNDVDVNSLDVSGSTTTDTLQADTSINVDGPVTADAGSVFDAGTNFVPDNSAANKSLVLGSSGATGGTNQLGASLAFSRINTTSPRAAIAAIETDGSFERMGLAFYTHRTNNGSDPMVRSMMIRHDGHVFIDNTNLVFSTAGTGIDFSATSGTGTSELFDDYEEGTFTPSFVASGVTITHDVQLGRYVKIGDMVTVWVNLGTDAVSGTAADLTISGLPYTTESGYSGGIAIGLNYSFTSAVQQLRFATSGTTIDIYQNNSATRQTSAILGTGANANRLQFSGSYRAA